jgi:hypothetical protein
MGLRIFSSPRREEINDKSNIYKRGVPNMCIHIIDAKGWKYGRLLLQIIYMI